MHRIVHFLLIEAVFLVIYVLVPGSTATYTVDTSRFASKTSYKSSSTDEERQQAREVLNIINSYCSPLQVASVLRHGTRNPSKGDINRINNVLKKLQESGLNATVFERLDAVVKQFPLNKQGELVRAGALEHEGIGNRMAETFKNIFSEVNPDDLLFGATTSPRTVDSCKAFQTGFFAKQPEINSTSIVIRDDILRFFDSCDKYNELEENTTSQLEYVTFQNKTFSEIITNFLRELQVPKVGLSNDEMTSVYQTSAIEFAALNTTYWGEHILPDDLLTLEYSNDLDAYYKIGFGYRINYEMSCPLLANIFHNMDRVHNGNQYLRGLFYFAHAETLTPLFDILGLYVDNLPLKASNYEQQTNRKFRTGRIVPFASNLAFVQYDCDVQAIQKNFSNIPEGLFPIELVRNMTLLMVKEVPVKLPQCEAFVCPYDRVRSTYSEVIDNCDYNAICENSVAPLSLHLNELLFFVLALICILINFQ